MIHSPIGFGIFWKVLLLTLFASISPSLLRILRSHYFTLHKVSLAESSSEGEMSNFGVSGHSDRTDTYSLLVLNVSFRMTADDLYPLFDKYGKVIDIYIPRDRRTGESRGFAFVRYKYQDEAQKAVDRLDGRAVDGREISVQFAKYGPNAERIEKGRIIENVSRRQVGSSSRSPQRRYRDDFYRNKDYRRSRSRSRSLDRYEHDRYHEREIDHIRSRSYSRSLDYDRGQGGRRYNDVCWIGSRSFERSLFSQRIAPPRNQYPERRKHRHTTAPGTLSLQKSVN